MTAKFDSDDTAEGNTQHFVPTPVCTPVGAAAAGSGDTEDITRPGRLMAPAKTPVARRLRNSIRAVSNALAEGARFGEYIVGPVVGNGGGGTVYAAEHGSTGQRVAIKVLRPEMSVVASLVRRFMQEWDVLSRLKHPNIVEVYEVGEIADQVPYYVMELLQGMDVRCLLEQHGRLLPAEVLSLLEPVAEALHAAHSQGIIHRDIKANNIFVCDVAGSRVIKLLDFGIAKMLQGEGEAPGLTKPGAWLGTAQYMAPEQIRAESVDARTDIYALGVLTFQLLTGEFPFHSRGQQELAHQQLEAPPPAPSTLAPISSAVEEVVLRCLQKTANKRFPSVPRFIEALRAAVTGQTSPAAATALQQVPGVGLRVELSLPEQLQWNDEHLEVALKLLDRLEVRLAEQGFVFPLRGSTILLAVRAVSAAGESSGTWDGQRHDALLSALAKELAALGEGAAALQVKATTRWAALHYRTSPDELSELEGPLLAAQWPLGQGVGRALRP